jgi:hypothetical protein
MKQKKVILPFIRMEGGCVSTLAIVTFTASSCKDPKESLREVVTAWVRETDSGKAVWEYSGGDLNIGDIASHDERGFAKYTELHGIKDFRVLYVGDTSDALPFDMVLADEPEGQNVL